MNTIGNSVSSSSRQILEQIIQEARTSQPLPGTPDAQAKHARAVQCWVHELLWPAFETPTSSHLTQAMLDKVPNGEMKAELILAVIIKLMDQKLVGLASGADSPFAANSMGEALERLLKLTPQGVTSGHATLVEIVESVAGDLARPNQGHQARLAEKIDLWVGFGEMLSLRLVGATEAHLSADSDGRWTLKVVLQGQATPELRQLSDFSTSDLQRLREEVLKLAGGEVGVPTKHAALAQLGGTEVSNIAILKGALEAIDATLSKPVDAARDTHEQRGTRVLEALVGRVDNVAMDEILRAIAGGFHGRIGASKF